MNIKKKVNKNLIAVSFVSTLLILWLSTTFWLEVYDQRTDAARIQASVSPEVELFKLADSLGTERYLAHRLFRHPQLNKLVLAEYQRQALTSNQLLSTVLRQFNSLRNPESSDPRHHSGTVDQLVSRLGNSFAELTDMRTSFQLNAGVEGTIRDADFPMRLFDIYSDLIVQTNNLRVSGHILPHKNYHEVVSAVGLKDALWSLRESTMQIGTMLDLAAEQSISFNQDQLDNEGLLLRLRQQQQIADHAVFDLDQILDRSGDTVENTAFESSYHEFLQVGWPNYKAIQVQLIEQLAAMKSDSDLQSAWHKIDTKIGESIDILVNEAMVHTLDTAHAIALKANQGLVLDTLLVLLCVGMAALSTGIARKVQHQATHDDLTQLPNRRYFAEHICDAVEEAALSAGKLALLSIDLNKFKAINDSMGHSVGDALLVKVAARLSSCVDERMCLARLGGDEFSILFQPGNDIEPLRLASRIVNELERDFSIDEGTINIGASIGVSCYPNDATTAAALQVNADYAMFFAKREGKLSRKSCVESFRTEMSDEFENRLSIERDLTIALEDKQLELYYQPQFNLAKNRVDAVEALVRWNHPQRGQIPPAEFITIAEECGLMPALGNWVLNEACRQAASWLSETDFGLRVAINVSVHQIMQPDFVEKVISTLDYYDLDTAAIELELTESVFMADSEWVVRCLVRLREAGIKIALDDFGTGYSSLSQLQDLPVSTLKIDRSFISRLNSTPGVSHSVTATIASIADVLGLETVAEGVESDLQHDQVADLGINVVQGFFYSRPMASGNVPEAIENLNQMHGDLQSAA